MEKRNFTHKTITFCIFVLLGFNAHSQINIPGHTKNVVKRMERKAERKTEKEATKKMDKGIENGINGKKEEETKVDSTKTK
ncbi:MAG: hypothetical protein SFY56_12545 [Bacteroidota bacterium]|nr:hypothetical protein [Bacteroidota bacterium]